MPGSVQSQAEHLAHSSEGHRFGIHFGDALWAFLHTQPHRQWQAPETNALAQLRNRAWRMGRVIPRSSPQPLIRKRPRLEPGRRRRAAQNGSSLCHAGVACESLPDVLKVRPLRATAGGGGRCATTAAPLPPCLG
jgi:hypothetical protein